MTSGDLFREIGNISEELIAEAEQYQKKTVISVVQGTWKKAADSASFRKTLAAAACLVVLVGIAVSSLHVGTDHTATEFAREDNGIAVPEAMMYELREESALVENDIENEESREAFIIAHGKVEAGQELWNDFLAFVDAGEAAEIDIVRYTVEGDEILETVSYDGDTFILYVDCSRDRFGSSENAYYEAEFKYLEKVEFETENGTRTVEYILSNVEKRITEMQQTGDGSEGMLLGAAEETKQDDIEIENAQGVSEDGESDTYSIVYIIE